MAEIVSGVVQKQLGANAQGMEKQMTQQSQNGQSFENVLQNGSQQNAGNQFQTNQIGNPQLETMRLDLINRYQNLPNGVPGISAVMPEFLDTKTRFTSFKDIFNKAFKVVGNTPEANTVQGRFTQLEGEWGRLDGLMRSGKDFSQGELLGIQAQLYQVSQHVDVLSKIVDQMTSGVKTVLNTNV